MSRHRGWPQGHEIMRRATDLIVRGESDRVRAALAEVGSARVSEVREEDVPRFLLLMADPADRALLSAPVLQEDEEAGALIEACRAAGRTWAETARDLRLSRPARVEVTRNGHGAVDVRGVRADGTTAGYATFAREREWLPALRDMVYRAVLP